MHLMVYLSPRASPPRCLFRRTQHCQIISMLRTILSKPRPALLHLPLQPVAWYSLQIVVPALGDSISDGTIATVLKKSGEAVTENETIAQVETDKVTIDIKSPSDGTLLGVVVQEQDTVVPGQLVATLDDSAAKAKLVGATTPPPQPAAESAAPAQPSPAAAPPPPAAAGVSAAAQHRVPGIRFPPRVTADGRRVSSLPAAEATGILQQWKASQTLGHPQPTAAAAAAPATATAHGSSSSSKDPFATWAAALRDTTQQQQQQQSGPDAPSKFASSVTRLTHMPRRRELSEKEMEEIELGGAAP